MAQGRRQLRSEKHCSSPKPRNEKECNVRSCHNIEKLERLKTAKSNTSNNQRDFNRKVDIIAGGTVNVIFGTPVIKIRCRIKESAG